MATQTPTPSLLESRLERRIWASRLALYFEAFWPRLWVAFGIIGLFILVSLSGAWHVLGGLAQQGALTLFGLALLVSLIFAGRANWPSRADGLRRLEHTSGVAHRPASSYEDQISASSSDPATRALWQAHRTRLASAIDKLRVGQPRPRVDQRDPLALRALLALSIVAILALAGDSALDRLLSGFRFAAGAAAPAARLDAWLTPPAYTARAPAMLADGSQAGGTVRSAASGPVEAPHKSVLIVRASGPGADTLALEVTREGSDSKTETVRAKPVGSNSDVTEIQFEIVSTVRVAARANGLEMANWTFIAIPDATPKIALSKEPEATRRGAMKLTYKVEDDYGVASAVAKFEKFARSEQDPAKAWARTDVLKGPRPPLDRPPELALRLPRPGAKEGEAFSHLELGTHPWAGIEVMMTLEAKDVAGQLGRSAPQRMVLPSRRFEKPLARAVVEQRRKLVEDPRYRPLVMSAIDALTLEPDGFIDDQRVYLGLRSVYHRLRQDRTRAGLKSVVEQLWHVALRIEDGDLSDAEKALQEAQDKLSKALEDGASEEEIKELMQELRQAMNDYMQQLAKQAENNPSEMPDGSDQQNQTLSQQDLDQMMKNIEEMAKNGSREQAQQMLSELRDLMDRMQTGRTDQKQAEQNQQMMEMMNQLGGLVGEQQKLMDDTFGEQRQQGQPQAGQQQGEQGKQGQQQGQGKQGQQGQRGGQKGQPGQKGQGRGQQQQGERGEGQNEAGSGEPGQRPTPGQLRERQAQLRERLDQLQREMQQGGAQSPEQLKGAQEAMEEAEKALDQGDYGTATEEQARALDQMRQGAQSMAQEMLQNSPQRFGQSGDTPRDPLGRPQRSQGPDLGTSVKVPGAIDMQRAREIMEELRRRLGDPQRPSGEIDYIERLLRRF